MAISDLLYVATHLQVNTSVVPAGFNYDYNVDKPERVYSPDEVFGPLSTYEFKDFYSRFYSMETRSWTDGGTFPAEEKALVLVQQVAYDLYLRSLIDWNIGRDAMKELEYRKFLAQKLIAIC